MLVGTEQKGNPPFRRVFALMGSVFWQTLLALYFGIGEKAEALNGGGLHESCTDISDMRVLKPVYAFDLS